MSKYLINIAVGPVQEFIASARKLKDLWYGSHLLSELSKSVAAVLYDQGCELIFPAVDDKALLQPNSQLNVANKIFAVSPEGSDPASLTAQARDAFIGHWEKICREAALKAPSLNQELFNKQIDDFGEFFAAWVPYEEKEYKKCRSLVEAKLGGRKSLRAFKAPAWDGTGLAKSSLDGIREAVLTGVKAKDKRSFQLKKGEHLDVLGVVKRFGPWNNADRPHFDNMAQVAARPYLAGLQKAAIKDKNIAELIPNMEMVKNLYPDFPEGSPLADPPLWEGWPKGLSSDLLHPAVLEEEKKLIESDRQKAWAALEKTLKKLWTATSQPSPYACLLLGDGDNMGKTLDAISTADGHRAFSASLESFAAGVQDIAKSYDGRIVYSGGDDVMAYAPLDSALNCAEAFNNLFLKIMEKVGNALKIAPPTFSLGMVIVHQRTPLADALALARQAEHTAKNIGGKNCLAVIQDKRSGSPLSIHGPWQGISGLPVRLKRYQEAIIAERLPSTLGYQLRRIADQCGPTLAWQNTTEPANPACAEALRIIGRKRDRSTKQLCSDDAAFIIQGEKDLRHISDELVIALQLARAKKLADAHWSKKEMN
ncbi:type III-B CRISPR-associated protein Cas10/Cmr2 [Desulfobacter hydrogenophilus]|uniref:Type III-B CRISPR-associated protein Cas10/Cmr2 n=1 Tax=Desulfobacter hydrogenophilus TaxID=2291 RepID=A0A328FE46_9BACT|nr:type III-B CRISPR-associated protein Cas10/Cmr2 [Desulfobacter hydrogenophilus]NDY71659.1 type III-B CRISPR-associated protein Cas10/Cmr2 [Desulfobacter hydrogenophilus]QBH13173.1 type III-B CRISPR-associated protein Cas10/Cmr2 [Desulfobacter hydrogenophilus]RAM02406.1 type III-B CRISPR-associated protein Cas10/Cmr2 [Desulfobacter hydrogenophilus]